MALSTDEVAFLTNADLSAAEDNLTLTPKSALDDAAKARSLYGEYGRAVVELMKARASGKIPTHWIADHDAVQQATPPEVARDRAQRLQGRLVHDVTCSIGTEGRFHTGPWLGSDLSDARLHMARHNLPGRWLTRADALTPVSRGAVIVADPARRSQGRRIKETIPPLDDLIEAWSGHDMAIKCAPGLDFSFWDGLVSVSSVGGSVKEACLYSPGLAEGKRREAIVHGTFLDRISDTDDDNVGAALPGEYIIDPDGAIVRAGLVRHFAAREGLWLLDDRIAHLTGNRIPAGYSGFKILEQVPLKKLKTAFKAHDAASAEILVRGVDVNPDRLRSTLELTGSTPRAIVVTRIGRSATAFICEARQHVRPNTRPSHSGETSRA